MFGYVARRAGECVVMSLAIVLIVFFLLRLVAGDPARIMALPGMAEKILHSYRVELGIDKPLVEQFWRFVSRLPAGDFGQSFRYRQPSLPLVLSRIPNTLLLASLSLLGAVVLAVVLGVPSARHRGSLLDRLGLMICVLAQSLPMFWIGLMLILVVAVRFRLLPVIGYVGARSLILPCATIATSLFPIMFRTVRASMIEVFAEDFIRTARAYGLRWVSIYMFALKNAGIKILTVVGVEMGYLLGGTIVAEIVFNYPGLGQLAMVAVSSRDFPLIQTLAIVTSTMFVFVNLFVDLLYRALDPRVRL